MCSRKWRPADAVELPSLHQASCRLRPYRHRWSPRPRRRFLQAPPRLLGAEMAGPPPDRRPRALVGLAPYQPTCQCIRPLAVCPRAFLHPRLHSASAFLCVRSSTSFRTATSTDAHPGHIGVNTWAHSVSSRAAGAEPSGHISAAIAVAAAAGPANPDQSRRLALLVAMAPDEIRRPTNRRPPMAAGSWCTAPSPADNCRLLRICPRCH